MCLLFVCYWNRNFCVVLYKRLDENAWYMWLKESSIFVLIYHFSASSSNPRHFGYVVFSLHPYGVFIQARFPRWWRWFQICFIFTPTWGNNPVWLAHVLQMGWWKTTNWIVSDWTQKSRKLHKLFTQKSSSSQRFPEGLRLWHCQVGQHQWGANCVCSWWISRVCLLKRGNWTKITVYYNGLLWSLYITG